MKLPIFLILTGVVTILFAGVQLKNKSKPNPYKCALGLEDHKPAGQISDGDIVYDGDLKRVPIGAEGQVIPMKGGIPEWQSVAGTGSVYPPKTKWTDVDWKISSVTSKFKIEPNDVGMSTKYGFGRIGLRKDHCKHNTLPEIFRKMVDGSYDPISYNDSLQRIIDSLKTEVKKAEYIINLIDSVRRSK